MKNLSPAIDLSPTLQQQAQTMPDHSQYRSGKIDPFVLQSLIENNPNLSNIQIAKLMSVSRQGVDLAIKRYDIDIAADRTYRENKANIFSTFQRRILAIHLTEERIKKMLPNVAPLWYNSLFNNERLERNQSPVNIQINQVSVIMDKLNKSQQDLTTQLAKLEE